mmetsp:Transcript_45156/g.104396  ORF Transcript_45156/g.104396 Transcript_45156/m.104396 type:complete len:236 (-) Transcript_45156:229-936(-)
MASPIKQRSPQTSNGSPIVIQSILRSEGRCTPTTPKAPPTRSAQSSGQRTGINSSLGLVTVHPQAENSSQPFLRIRCSRVSEGRPSQLQLTLASSRTSLLDSHELQTPDCSLEMKVFSTPALPHMLWDMPALRFSYPGTATSMWSLGASQPGLAGGHRPFFMSTAVQSVRAADGLRMSKHLPQPPPPSLSLPQQSLSGPSNAETASETLPVSQSRSPCEEGPPKSAGSVGAYWEA